MARGPQPTSLVIAERPGSESRKLPDPVRVLLVGDEDAQVALARTGFVLLALTPALVGLYVGHPWPRGFS
jgi:hypothetical protein